MPRTMPAYDPDPITYVSSGEDDVPYVENSERNSRHIRLEPNGSTHSNYSINAKPTHATLAETFSDPHHSYEYVDARDDLGSREFGGNHGKAPNGLEYTNSEDTNEALHQGRDREGGIQFVDSEDEEYVEHGRPNEAEGQYYRNTNGLEYADSETE